MARRSRNARHDSLHHESLESRALLAVTASLVGSELRINLDAANDAASLRVEGGTYAVQSGSQAVGSFNVATVASIRVTGDAAQANQSLFIKPGGVVAAPLTVNAGVEATVVNAPIVTAGGVTIDSPAITLAEDVRTSGNQTYAGLVRVADDIVLDAGAGTIHFRSQIRSTVGQRAALMEDIGAPYRLALSPNGQTLYATDAVSNFVYVVDLQAQQLDTVDLGKSVGNVVIAPNGSRLYVANTLDGSVSVLDTTSRGVVATINTGGTPEGMAITADGLTLFVANYSDNTVAVVSTATNRVLRTIAAAGSPTAVAAAPGGKLWVAAEASNAAVEFDVATGALLRQVAVGRGPADIAVSPDGTRVYVANNFDNTVSIIDTTTAAVLATVGVGSGPTEIVVSPDGRLVYVVNGFSDSVTVIDAASRTVATTVPVGTLPVGIVLSADGRTAYVANLNSLTELGNDPRSLTVRTTGTARFDAPESTVDPLRALVINAGRRIGPLITIAEVRGTTLARDSATQHLLVNGAPVTFNGSPLSYTHMQSSGFTAIAAANVNGQNRIVWRTNTGLLHHWRMTPSWGYGSSFGWQAPGSTPYNRSESAFGIDFDGNGRIAVSIVRGITLNRDVATSLLTVNGSPVLHSGQPVSYDHMANQGFTAVAAGEVNGQNRIVWRTDTGLLHHWRMTPSWGFDSSFGWQAPGTTPFNRTEAAFDMDFDGDGRITISAIRGLTFARDVASGSLLANGTTVLHDGRPVSFSHMQSSGFTAIAAADISGGNRIVWRTSTGLLHHWRMTSSWGYSSSFGWQAPGTTAYNQSETAFETDFDGNGRIGA